MEAHRLLTSGLAAKLFLGPPAENATLRRALNLLHPHRREVDAGLGAGTYRSGAGLFAAFHTLQKVNKTPSSDLCLASATEHIGSEY